MNQENLEELLRLKTETNNVDFKLSLNWLSASKDEKIGLIKDILAMANTQDGGNIVFGVRDGDLEFVGMPEDDCASFDTTKVNDLLHEYADPKYSCRVHKTKLDEKSAVVLHVPEFSEMPILCKKEYVSASNQNKLILKRGGLYIRTDKATSELISAHEMRGLLGRALSKRKNELLQDIQRLLSGAPGRTQEAALEKYEQELKEAGKFLYPTVGSKTTQHGSWEICAYPLRYEPNRIEDPQSIKELISKSTVSLRGWNFPHQDRENAGYFNHGHQSVTSWEAYIEGYRAYQSGLFIWQGIFDTDARGSVVDNRKALSFVDALWTITEFFLFFSRYYEAIGLTEECHVRLTLTGTANRQLATFDPMIDLRTYIAKEATIVVEGDFNDVDLKTSWKAIANKFIRRAFLLFGWENPTEAMIDGWQEKLIQKNF